MVKRGKKRGAEAPAAEKTENGAGITENLKSKSVPDEVPTKKSKKKAESKAVKTFRLSIEHW